MADHSSAPSGRDQSHGGATADFLGDDRPQGRRGPHVQSFVLGLLFACVALTGAWYALGHHLGRATSRFLVPVVLIVVGLLGIAVSRRRP